MAEEKSKEQILAEMEALQTMSNSSSDSISDRLGASARSGIFAAQKGENPLSAAFNQYQQPSDTAPSGEDIAEATGVDSVPYKTAIASIADLINPAPGGPVGSVAKKMRTATKAGNIAFPSRNAAEGLLVKKLLEKQGRVPKGSSIQFGEKILPGSKKLDNTEFEEILQRFPALKDKLRG